MHAQRTVADVDPPAPFVVGAPRSGTTLLRMMLDAHPEIAIPAESHFYPALLAVDRRRIDWLDAALTAMTQNHAWGDFGIDAATFERSVRHARPSGLGDVVRMFYRCYAVRLGKSRWGDKFPGNVLNMSSIAALLPEARFVHIIRDGRDVAASLRGRWWRPEGDTYEACIALWSQRIRSARTQAARGLPYIEVRYESLVRSTRQDLERVCAFIQAPYDEVMLRYAERAGSRLAELSDWRFEGRLIPRETLFEAFAGTQQPPSEEKIGRWRTEMTATEAEACRRIAGDLLDDLGYT